MTYSRKNILVLGFALFAIFFGAGNLIFPPALGRTFGDRSLGAALGFLLTGVGLPLLGLIAVAKAEGGIDHIARRVSPAFGQFLFIVIVLAIGPLFAIPRTCATTFELGVQPHLPWVGSWLFAFIYFGAVLVFALNPLAVVDRIGKILTPLLLASLAYLIVRGIVSPIAAPASTVAPNPFGQSLVEGYQTMDLIGATIIGIIILNELRSKGLFDKRQQMLTIVKAGMISTGFLALIYCGLIYLGATASGIPGEFTRTGLLTMISQRLAGGAGGAALAIAVSMACLTTAVGLTTLCAEYFHKLSRGRISYRLICIAVAIVSLVLSNAGVETIVSIAVPLLLALYPVVMVLVLLCLAGRVVENRNIWRGAVIGAGIVGCVGALRSSGVESTGFEALFTILPLHHHGLGWVVPAAIGGALGALVRPKALPSFRVLAVCPSQLATRVAIFDDDVPVCETSIPHRLRRVMSGEERALQLAALKDEVAACLARNSVDLSTVQAVVGRGGFLRPLPGGTYRVTPEMLRDLEQNAWRQHPSNWGAAIAFEVAQENRIPAFIVDPVAVDEMDEVATLSGLPEIRRASIFHASNQKAVVRRAAKNLWKRHDQINAIVAHMGEGTSVGAHRRGKVVDVNNALDGDGPFSALNAGSLPTVDVVRMCFTEGASEKAVLHRIRSAGGLLAYLGTSDAAEIDRRVEAGDADAIRAIEAMGYQVAKEIGALASALAGRVHAIALTGELAICRKLMRAIRARVDFIAPVFVYPGESETSALVGGALRVLRGEEELLEYRPG